MISVNGRWRKLVGVSTVVAALHGCMATTSNEPAPVATGPTSAPAAPVCEARADLTPRQHIREAKILLGGGRENECQALAELNAARLDPVVSARQIQRADSLIAQIEKMPADIFTSLSGSWNYTVRRGDTISGLANRFLGDANLFYALSRYNNFSRPDDLSPGRDILIPGSRPVAPPPPDSQTASNDAEETQPVSTPSVDEQIDIAIENNQYQAALELLDTLPPSAQNNEKISRAYEGRIAEARRDGDIAGLTQTLISYGGFLAETAGSPVDKLEALSAYEAALDVTPSASLAQQGIAELKNQLRPVARQWRDDAVNAHFDEGECADPLKLLARAARVLDKGEMTIQTVVMSKCES